MVENENVNIGFDAANECMVDMIATGIIDPAKVSPSHLSIVNMEYKTYFSGGEDGTHRCFRRCFSTVHC